LSSSASRTRRRVAGERTRTRPPAPSPSTPGAQAGQPARSRPSVPQAAAVSAPPATPAAAAPPAQARPQPAPAPGGSGARAPQVHGAAEQAPRTRHTGRLLAPAAGLGAALLLLAGAVGLSLSDPSGEDAQTRAATSTARTSIEQMLSYNYKTIDAQAAQIETQLTGSFKNEFTQAMDKDIKPLAVKNKTVVQARVSDVGVMEAADGRVKVLAFVNQAKVGADEKQPAIDQNRVIATLTKVGDRWLISEVSAF
jgi:Mce-associated membrane protein